MTGGIPQPVRLAMLGWLATVLTSLAFVPALADRSYLPEGAFFAGCVVAVGILLRSIRTPSVAVFIAQLVALGWLLVIRFGTDLWHGLIPTPATWTALESTIRHGFDVAQKYPAPAPSNEGLLLMVVFAVCVTAVFVDVLAVGLGRVPLAGLPLLALYTIPVAALPTGVPFLAFVPGAAAFIAMITSDERDRLVHWGRLVSRNSDRQEPSSVDTSGLHATGRQVSTIALATAVVVPILLPAVSGSLLDAGRGNGDGNGGGGSLSFKDPMVSLAEELNRAKDVNLFHVTTNGDADYIRLAVLNDPGPDAWRVGDVDSAGTISLAGDPTLPAPTGQTSAVAVHGRDMTIRLMTDFPGDSLWLPVPFGSTNVTVDAPFAYVPRDQIVTASESDAIGHVDSYRVAFDRPVPTEAQLRAAGAGGAPADIKGAYGTIPPGVPQLLYTKTADITEGDVTDYEKAVDLQQFFRTAGEFDYDTKAAYGDGYIAMASFLEARRGFCQQFSATMAMMARIAGIPSRVVVGFLTASNSDATGPIVTSQDFHAWPELYFQGVGWVRFEPTPGINAPAPSYAPLTKDDGSGNLGHPTDDATTPTSQATKPTLSAVPTAGPTGGSGSGGPLPSRGWLILVAVVLVVLLPAALRRGVRQARLNRPLDGASAAEAAWLELRDHVRDLRLPWSGSMTPRARERSLTPLLLGDAAGLGALHRLAMCVERARYAPLLDTGVDSVSSDARTLITVISRNTDRRQRVRAFLWPSSLMPDIRRAWARLRTRLRRT